MRKMKITIDTKEDSKEEIRKAIELLQRLADGSIQKDEINSELGSMMGMFDEPKKENTEPAKEEKEDLGVQFY